MSALRSPAGLRCLRSSPPLRGPRSGGLLLKQRNPAGDRSVLVRETLGDRIPIGRRSAHWDDEQAALRIPLERES